MSEYSREKSLRSMNILHPDESFLFMSAIWGGRYVWKLNVWFLFCQDIEWGEWETSAI